MPPIGGDISITYRASEVVALGNRRYDECWAAAALATTPPLDAEDGRLIAIKEWADLLADAILDRPFADPDDDLAKLARRWFRQDPSAMPARLTQSPEDVRREVDDVGRTNP